MSQANRRSGDLAGAEDAARRLIAAQDASPWGYFALAEALGEGRQFARVVDALVPAIAKFRGMSGDHALELGMLLPHLGFAHQELGEYDKALATFDEAYRLSPKDPVVAGYLDRRQHRSEEDTPSPRSSRRRRGSSTPPT